MTKSGNGLVWRAMELKTRETLFRELFPAEPAFRWRQIVCALFDPALSGWGSVTTLSKFLRDELSAHVSWMSVREVAVLESRKRDTKKAVLECADGARIETVLMRNARGHWSVCVSSQVGCAMGCTFCATGSMGFTRNLSVDEIIDQFRFWQYLLLEQSNHASYRQSDHLFCCNKGNSLLLLFYRPAQRVKTEHQKS